MVQVQSNTKLTFQTVIATSLRFPQEMSFSKAFGPFRPYSDTQKTESCHCQFQLLLERDPGEMAVDSKTFSRLKQSNAMRLEVLRHLLSLLELDTSVAPSHTLTPCYLLAEDQVSVVYYTFTHTDALLPFGRGSGKCCVLHLHTH